MFNNLNCIGCYKRVFDVFYFHIVFCPSYKNCPKIICPFRPRWAKHYLGCDVLQRKKQQDQEIDFFQGKAD